MRHDEPGEGIRLTGTPVAAAVGALAVLALAAALRLPWLAAERLWFDEVFSVVVASQDPGELLRRVIADQTNPPGFYLLLAAWVRLGGYDEAWVRLLPAITGVLVPLALVLAARAAEVPWRPAIVAGLLAAASPLLIDKSIDVRAYSLLALEATAALGVVLHMARRRTAVSRAEWVLLIALELALVATHYFGALSVIALTLAAPLAAPRAAPLTRRQVGTFLLTALPAVVTLGAWFLLLARRDANAGFGENASWIAEPSLASAPGVATQFIGAFGSSLFAWLVLAVLLRTVAWALAESDDRLPRALAVAALVPLALALLVGWAFDRPLWLGRYFIAAIPPLLLLVALAIERAGVVAGARTRLALATSAIGWATLAGLHAHGTGPRKPDWPAIIGALARDGPSVACVNEGYVGLGLEYYALRDGLPLEVRAMRDCGPTDRPTWTVYRPGTEAALEAIVARGGRLGNRFSLVTDLPVTEARRVTWPAKSTDP